MGRERWWVDGHVTMEITDGWVRDVELRDGLYRVAAPRITTAPVIAARHGELYPGRRKHGAGGFELHVWAGNDSRALLEAQYDDILRLCAQQFDSVQWRRQLADGTTRVTDGRLIDTVSPEAIGNEGMRFVLTVGVHSGFWRDEDPSSDILTGGPGTLALTSKARNTGPADDMRCIVTGPATNPAVVDTRTGLGWAFAGTVGAGQTLTVGGSQISASGDGGLLLYLDEFAWTGDTMLEVQPLPGDDPPSVNFTATGTSSATQLEVAGHGCYLA